MLLTIVRLTSKASREDFARSTGRTRRVIIVAEAMTLINPFNKVDLEETGAGDAGKLLKGEKSIFLPIRALVYSWKEARPAVILIALYTSNLIALQTFLTAVSLAQWWS